jgi:hypothetical protein
MGIVKVKEQTMITDKERVVQILKSEWQFDRKSHGGLFDRGSADSYYGRPRNPHYGGVGGDSGPRVDQGLSIAEITEYYAGYEHNERFGDKKDYR